MLPNRREALKQMAAGVAAIAVPTVVPAAAAPVAASPLITWITAYEWRRLHGLPKVTSRIVGSGVEPNGIVLYATIEVEGVA